MSARLTAIDIVAWLMDHPDEAAWVVNHSELHALRRSAGSDPVNLKTLDALKQHVRQCPIGWHRGELKLHRATTPEDVIAWIQELERLVGVAQDGSATETRLPRPHKLREEP